MVERAPETRAALPDAWRALDAWVLGLGVFITLCVAVLTMAAHFGVFHMFQPVAWAALALALSWPVIPAGRRFVQRRHMASWDMTDRVAVGLASFFAIITASRIHASLSIYDTDIYLTTAAWIARTGSLAWPLGPYDGLLAGVATSGGYLHTAASPGYPVMLALAATAMGPFQAAAVNAFLVPVGLLALYAASRRLMGAGGALLGMVLVGSSFFTWWYARLAMTENLVFSIVAWMVLASYLGGRIALPLVCLGAIALGVSRPEGVFVGAWMLGVHAVAARRHAKGGTAARISKAALGAGVALVAALTVVPWPYIVGGLRRALLLLGGHVASDDPGVPVTGPSPHWGDYALRYVVDSWNAYGLLWTVAGVALGVVWLRGWRAFGRWAALVAPFVIFLVMPPVTTAHPWFMRRYAVALIPVVLVAAAFALTKLHAGSWRWKWWVLGQRARRWAVLVLALALMWPGLAVAPVFPEAVDDGTAQVIERLSALDDEALIILDQDAQVYALWLRLNHGPHVLAPSLDTPIATWLRVLAAVDTSRHVYLVQGPLPPEAHLVRATPLSEPTMMHFETRELVAQRMEFKSYLAYPPLAQGYAPLATYVETQLPPTRLGTQGFSYTVREMKTPLEVYYGAHPEGNWTPHGGTWIAGQQARWQPDWPAFGETFPDHVLHVAYLQHASVRVTLDDGTFVGDLPSDGSGSLAVVSLAVPGPMTAAPIHVSEGAHIRGLILAPAAFG